MFYCQFDGLLLACILLEVEGDAVDTVSLVSRSLVALALEHMAEVTATDSQLPSFVKVCISLPVGTGDFDAGHEHRLVLMPLDSSRNGIEESWPPASRCTA